MKKIASLFIALLAGDKVKITKTADPNSPNVSDI